ncbi:ATP-binding protein [Spirillospora sp. NPDC047279]|uniref:ATP-binding protein n=1 Tax=Spirillospora sp. NPDC047279 TaxID=3155478 RepID=UPI00340E64E5
MFEVKCLASKTLASQMRMSVSMNLISWGFTGAEFEDLRDNVLSVASELLNNAIERTPERGICFRCYPDPQLKEIFIAVWDSSPGDPCAQMPEISLEGLDLQPDNFDDNGGWGLPIVMARSDRQGVEHTKTGKWVWAALRFNHHGG